MTRKLYCTTKEHLADAGDIIRDLNLPEHGCLIEIRTGTRTLLQNRALYKLFELYANALNDAGLSIHMEYLGKSIEVPFTPESVKERLWLPIMLAMTGKTSTAKLDRKEPSQIYDVLDQHMGENHGIHVPWPSNEPPMMEEYPV